MLREPIGVVSIITPWNFPFLIVSQKLPFALAAGCTTVVKPAEVTSGTTVMLGEILLAAGVPAGVVNILVGRGSVVGDVLVTHPDVDMLSFTGSTGVGKQAVAKSAQTLKKVSMELGGKNPQIVFPDCDWDAALDAAVFGIYFNAGQCCNSGSRILVHESIAEKFAAAVVERSKLVKVGDPLVAGVQVGAITTDKQLETILSHVDGARRAGATVALGGSRMDSDRHVRRAHRRHRRDPRHGDRQRRGVRPGAVGADLQGPRRSRRTGQQHALRLVRRGVEPGLQHLPAARRAASRRARSGSTPSWKAMPNCRSAAIAKAASAASWAASRPRTTPKPRPCTCTWASAPTGTLPR